MHIHAMGCMGIGVGLGAVRMQHSVAPAIDVQSSAGMTDGVAMLELPLDASGYSVHVLH